MNDNLDIISLRKWISEKIAEIIGIQETEIELDKSFMDYGLSSMDAVSLSGELEELVGKRLSPTLVFDYPNILALSEYLVKMNEPKHNQSKQGQIEPDEPIAVIGMACRFPGANDPEAYWDLLINGSDKITEVPKERWAKESFFHPDPSVPGKTVSNWGGFLNQVDKFDPFFFGISPNEAKHMDPQQRLLMELSYEALDDAGHNLDSVNGSMTGVFMGISTNEYGQMQTADPFSISSHTGTGSALSIAANRISYFYNFKGPSLAVDTACSSSLSAVHLACQSIRNNECTTALAGGVNIILSPTLSIGFTKAGVLAPDGRCKTFDAKANGYTRGEGGGIVVLKSLSAALADGDTIHAVIKGSCTTQDGRTNGLMAPSQESQEILLRKAYSIAGVDPKDIQYIEAHGTGTLLGDSMEANALGKVLGSQKSNSPIFIGSAKTNIGHLEAAAGIAGLIKVVLSLRHKTIPPSLNFTEPSPLIPFEELNLKVQREKTSWPSNGGSRSAGVSSFGFGGTNVHVILQGTETSTDDKIHSSKNNTNSKYLLPLSEQDNESLALLAEQFLDLLISKKEYPIEEICSVAAKKRSSKCCRLVCVGATRNELIDGLKSFLKNEPNYNVVYTGDGNQGQPKSVFVFSGHGSQWIGMGRGLMRSEPVFKEAVEKIDRLIRAEYGWSVIQEILLDPQQEEENIGKVQPSIFAIQVGLVKLWESWGISPNAVIGHSMGEVTAAFLSGIITLEDSVKIICLRSQLLSTLQGKGTMLATDLSESEAIEIISGYEEHVSIGAINGPNSTFLSGAPDQINELKSILESKNLYCKFVKVNIAPHSPQMDSLRPKMVSKLSDIGQKLPQIPFYSTVVGNANKNQKFDANYWVDNIRKPVLFATAIKALLDENYTTFIEVGPHSVLLGSIQQTAGNSARLNLLPSMRRDENQQEVPLRSLAALYVEGCNVKWENVQQKSQRYIPIPSVIWNRQRYWLDHNEYKALNFLDVHDSSHSLLGERISVAHSPNTLLWQTRLNNKVYNLLKDHIVENQVVFPAAGYIEVGIQALKELNLITSYDLTNFIFNERLVIEDGKNQLLQVAITNNKEEERLLHIHSQVNESWVLHASSSLKKREKEISKNQHFNTKKFIAHSDTELFPVDFYNFFNTRGIQYGPGFQGVKNVWAKGHEALASVRLSDSQEFEMDQFTIHPALLDSCLQVVSSASNSYESQELYLPSTCQSIRYYSNNRVVWSHAAVTSERSNNNTIIKANINLLDENGEVVMEIEGFQLQKLDKNLSESDPENIWMYKLAWQAQSNSENEKSQVEKIRNWIILSDEAGTGENIGQELIAKGDSCHFLSVKQILENDATSIEEQLEKTLQTLLKQTKGTIHGIIHLWSLDLEYENSTLSKIDNSAYFCANSALNIVQLLSKIFVGSPRIWLVTKGVHAVDSGSNINVNQSPIWGLGKVISYEFPEFKCTRLDLDPKLEASQSFGPFYNELFSDAKEDQIALRGENRYVLRLLPFKRRSSNCATQELFNKNASYIVTGGLSGLGLATAKWMINGGARNLVLLGRSNPSQSVSNEIEEMTLTGASISTKQIDVCDANSVENLVNEMEPQLKGIIHAAGVVDDDSLLNLDPKRMQEVMAPKVTGTWNLHAATLNVDLDFFIMYSSAVSVLGSPGQGNYAAGNAYLDTMASYRQTLGLSGLSINWGPWAEIGLAVELTEKLEEQNASTEHLVKTIKVHEGLQTLENLLKDSNNQAQIVALPFNLKDLLELYPPAAGMPFFEQVGGKETHIARLYARPNLKQEYVAPRTEIELKMAELWQQTLHIDKVGIHDSFFELGGDSVLAAQVLSLARKIYGINIDPKRAFQSFTIESLSSMLEEEILKQVEEMSEEEVQKLLSDNE